jgi:crotonobetainyl-CoA:carnitine CoA-transferase CaiB-like acyl-CoA transferase
LTTNSTLGDHLNDRIPALSGLTVVDFTRMLAGPYCTQQLADLGARVIKIERPETGDDSRRPTPGVPGGGSSLFLSANRGKRSIVLDLKSGAGKQLARQLCDRADVVVENFSVGVMDRLGLGYGELRKGNPGLIYCSISGFGADDESRRRAYDAVLQAASGFMSVTGDVDGPPLRTAIPVIDTAAASAATIAVLAALAARARDGEGQLLEVALIDVAVSMLTTFATAALLTGSNPRRNGNRAAQSAPSDVFATADGWISVTCGNDRLFQNLARALQLPELADDPDYATTVARVRNQESLTVLLARRFAVASTSEWSALLARAGVPAAPVIEILEALDSPDVRRRGLVTRLPHEQYGMVPLLAPAYRLHGTPTVEPRTPPDLGVDTDEILSQILGLGPADLERAAQAGAFGQRT